jgi:hypothetical protein
VNLHGGVLLGRVERAARELHPLVHRSGEVVLTSVANPRPSDDVTARLFLEAKFAGFREAQELIVEGLLRLPPDDYEAVVLRKFADSMAWHMLRFQLYLARRIYKGERPPSLKDSSFESVREAANTIVGGRRGAFALYSDTTSFVQVGDLLVADLDGPRLTFVEVKSGERNERILDFMEFLGQGGGKCQRALAFFVEEGGESSVKQLKRMMRQHDRMAHVRRLIREGRSRDPDEGLEVVVPDEELIVKSYAAELRRVLGESHACGWALDVIDECLFIAAYRGVMRGGALFAFKPWLEHKGGEGSPCVDLMQSMHDPLALSIFDRDIDPEHGFDLVAGRAKVLMGLHVGAFMERARKLGFSARWGTRKESGRFRNQPKERQPIYVNDRVLMIEREGESTPLFGGILERIFFHGTRPDSALEALGAMMTNLRQVVAEDAARRESEGVPST